MTAPGETPLLAITTAAGQIEIHGPCAPPAGLMTGIAVEDHGQMRVTVLGDDAEPTVTYLDTTGQVHAWNVGTNGGPLLFEEVSYQFWADGTDQPPVVSHRDPLFARTITHREQQRSASGTFNLQRQIGTLRFAVSFGAIRIEIQLEVVPTKIDYRTDYQQLIGEVAAGARGLALAYMRSTHTGAHHTTARSTEIEWLTVLRQRIEDLRNALHRVNSHPHRHLLREVRPTPNFKVRRLDSTARRAITRGKGSGPVDDVPGLGPVRRNIDSINAIATLDTPEHRWLRTQIHQLHLEIQAISAVLDREARNPRTPIGERRKAERTELRGIAGDLERLLDLDVLRQAPALPQPSPPSLTLIGAPGYRDAYRILTELRLSLAVGGDALDLQTKDIHDLYELWAFIEVVRLVAVHTGSVVDATSLIRHHSGGLRVDLTAGVLSEVDIDGALRSFTVAYNRTYPGQTGDQKPDIVVRVREMGSPDLVIVLDAKYRVDATTKFRKRYGAPGPPIDAINALHRYRDAIVTKSPDPLRPVVRCAALFPLTNAETAAFAAHSALYASHESLGVGALPFLPGNTDLAGTWLDRLLALPTDVLAWNGPPGPDVQAPIISDITVDG